MGELCIIITIFSREIVDGFSIISIASFPIMSYIFYIAQKNSNLLFSVDLIRYHMLP